jgi:hypothetical protein
MNSSSIFLVVLSIIAVIVLFSIVPMMQSSISYTGLAITNATGYSSSSTEADNAISQLWGVAPGLVILALFAIILLEKDG